MSLDLFSSELEMLIKSDSTSTMHAKILRVMNKRLDIEHIASKSRSKKVKEG